MSLPEELINAFEIFPDVTDHADLMHRTAIAAANLSELSPDRRVEVAAAIDELLSAYREGGWEPGVIEPIEYASNVRWQGKHAEELREVLAEILACLRDSGPGGG